MNIYILTEGGKEIGFGHICRCLALYKALKKNRINPVLVINGDISVKEILPKEETYLLNWLEELNFLKQLEKAHAIIIDSYLAPLSFYKKLASLPSELLIIDDFNRLPYPRGIILNSAPFSERLSYPSNSQIKYLLGLKYALLRPAFWKTPHRKIKENVKNILVTLGGSDIVNFTPELLTFLKKEFPNFKKKVVIGKSFKNISEIEKIKDINIKLIYFPTAKKMRDIMLSVDIAISAGGQTLYELSCTGTPTVAIITAENQIYNVNGLTELGIVENAGWYNSSNFWKKLKIILTSLIDNKTKREKMAQKGQTLVNGQGAKRVAEILISAIKKDLS